MKGIKPKKFTDLFTLINKLILVKGDDMSFQAQVVGCKRVKMDVVEYPGPEKTKWNGGC